LLPRSPKNDASARKRANIVGNKDVGFHKRLCNISLIAGPLTQLFFIISERKTAPHSGYAEVKQDDSLEEQQHLEISKGKI